MTPIVLLHCNIIVKVDQNTYYSAQGRQVLCLSINLDLIHTLLWEVLWLACMQNVGV